MKQISFYYKDSLVSNKELTKFGKKLQDEIKNMQKAIKLNYNDDRASINLVNDKENLNNIKRVIKEKLKLKPTYLIVIGVGGSNLGTIAVQEAVLGKFYNQLNPNLKVLYADTVDSDLINSISKIIIPVLKSGKNIIINGISKSGTTTETIANFEILINLLKKYKKNYEKYVVVTTDKNSKLWNLALKKGFSVLEAPKKVGGRYSVFSAVGLFPLGLLNINITRLLEGASTIRKRCLDKNIKNNYAALSALLLYINYKKGKNINDLFLFGNDLESIGKWYRQLMGESIGKEFDRNRKKVYIGITPTVSVGSTDLHSMLQLYLGGPYDKFTSFVKVENYNSNILIPNFNEYSSLVKDLQRKSLKDIMNSIYNGVKTSFMKRKRPFSEIILPDKSEYSIGQLLQLKMIEIMYLGYLLNVNPFNQPNVELYKTETRKILKKK